MKYTRKTTTNRRKTTSKNNKPKIYKILDNGGYPFTVHVFPSHLDIYNRHQSKPVYSSKYSLIYIGKNYDDYIDGDKWPLVKPSRKDIGNSILFLNKNVYTYIGSEIYSFRLDDDIIHSYLSPIGNSAVPYPLAIGDKYTYFMIERKRIENKDLVPDIDPYSQLYNKKATIPPKIHKLKVKIICKRE